MNGERGEDEHARYRCYNHFPTYSKADALGFQYRDWESGPGLEPLLPPHICDALSNQID